MNKFNEAVAGEFGGKTTAYGWKRRLMNCND